MVVSPEKYNPASMAIPISTKIAIFVLIISTIMVLALTASIALLFTIGKPNNNDENQLSTVLAEPCECGCPAISPQITTRIVNGEAAVPNSWPWQLLLVVFTLDGIPFSYCGATLITPQHVLTAAHCVFGWSPRYIGVIPRLHDFNISSWSPSIAYMAERIYVHESYDDRSLNDDVAVIRLRTPVSLDERLNLICIAPADASSQPLLENAPLVATGWGVLESANRTRPTVLQQVRLGFVPQTNPLCAAIVGTDESARPGQMCAGFPPKAVCFGDSGGPLVRSVVHPNGQTYWQQVGVMSGTVDCGYQTNYPDVYARVSYYNPWIIDKIRTSS
jgi:chymotrypsin C